MDLITLGISLAALILSIVALVYVFKDKE